MDVATDDLDGSRALRFRRAADNPRRCHSERATDWKRPTAHASTPPECLITEQQGAVECRAAGL
jgi:hypothetical protein